MWYKLTSADLTWCDISWHKVTQGQARVKYRSKRWPKLPKFMLIVYLPKIFSWSVHLWSSSPAECWHCTELRTTHKWPVYWLQVRYAHEHPVTHLTLGSEVSTVPALSQKKGARQTIYRGEYNLRYCPAIYKGIVYGHTWTCLHVMSR